jgi:hypothetical protein
MHEKNFFHNVVQDHRDSGNYHCLSIPEGCNVGRKNILFVSIHPRGMVCDFKLSTLNVIGLRPLIQNNIFPPPQSLRQALKPGAIQKKFLPVNREEFSFNP